MSFALFHRKVSVASPASAKERERKRHMIWFDLILLRRHPSTFLFAPSNSPSLSLFPTILPSAACWEVGRRVKVGAEDAEQLPCLTALLQRQILTNSARFIPVLTFFSRSLVPLSFLLLCNSSFLHRRVCDASRTSAKRGKGERHSVWFTLPCRSPSLRASHSFPCFFHLISHSSCFTWRQSSDYWFQFQPHLLLSSSLLPHNSSISTEDSCRGSIFFLQES